MGKRSNGEGTIYKRNDGRWCAAYYDTEFRRHYVYGKTQSEVKKKLKDREQVNSSSKPSQITVEEWVREYLEKFKKNEKYPGTEFFEWHHYLTGSCLMGRNAFVRNHGLDLKAMYTVDEFIALCEDDYGGKIIKELKEKWEMM